MSKDSFSEVQVIDVTSDSIIDRESLTTRRCSFCEKETPITKRGLDLLRNFSRDSKFYCTFCIRHNFHTKKRHNVLMLSFRALIGYLYYTHYYTKTPTLYLCQIQDLINWHVMIGEQNPVFTYDPDTYCWFIDFEKIGKSNKRIPLQEVFNTIHEIVSAFNPYENIKDFSGHKYIERFTEAIKDFYAKRYRPEGKPICVPTLTGCANNALMNSNTFAKSKIDSGTLKNFLPSCLILYSKT